MQPESPEGVVTGRGSVGIPVGGLLVAMLAWLWPMGIGGRMPVGGDVTQFFLGLMGFLSQALRAGELPVWNDLWGFGFPGLAESQMGVFYPPHLLLYRTMSTEAAYVASLVGHTIWGALGTFWAARRMGISPAGSALAAFAWSTSGFFVIHLAHPWGYTTGSWMPWAWGLGWSILQGGDRGRMARARPFGLSLVLVMQLLPGHFQIAFQTQVGLGLMVAWAVVRRLANRRDREPATEAPAPAPTFRRGAAVVLSIALAFPMAAMQLVPTARLAGMAVGQRDFEYLSGFAESPLHLVNLVAPGLFHREPGWRPLAWDPFHTSPEECLIYIGLVPLFLAVMAILREFRRDPAVRLLTILAAATLLLSLGPFVPGFRGLIVLPGFSFFRGPSRWTVATSMALAILAGKGFDRWRGWSRPGRSIRRLAFAAALGVLVVLALIELAVWSTDRQGVPAVAAGFDRAFRAMPWYGDPSLEKPDPRFADVMASARRPIGDPHVPPELPASVVLRKTVKPRSLVGSRWSIYARELGETAAVLALIGLLLGTDRAGDRRTRSAPSLLLLLTFLDLWTLGRHRLLDTGPIRPITEQSPVLARLAAEPRGSRVISGLGNLPMLVGSAPTLAYRTLNLPAADVMATASMSDPSDSTTLSAIRASGTRMRLFPPIEIRVRGLLRRTDPPGEPIDDPALARWIYGADWVAEQGDWVNRFRLWRCNDLPARAWFLPASDEEADSILSNWTGDPARLATLLEQAEPLLAQSSRPEDWTVEVEAQEDGWVILSRLDDPQWQARWMAVGGRMEVPARIRPAFRRPKDDVGGWQAIPIPAPGRWTLRLTYDPADLREGLAIAIVGWSGWVLCGLAAALRRRPSA